MSNVLLVVLSLLVGLGRFAIPGHSLSWPGTYEAFAHLWIGGLLGAWWVSRDRKLLGIVGLLTVLETAMFFAR